MWADVIVDMVLADQKQVVLLDREGYWLQVVDLLPASAVGSLHDTIELRRLNR